MDAQATSPADIEMKRLQARIRILEEQLHEQRLKDRHLRACETGEPRQQGDCLRQLIEHSSNALVDAEDVDLPLDLAVPCGMIVNELVTNAMKYAFPNLLNKGRNNSNAWSIYITMRQTDATYTSRSRTTALACRRVSIGRTSKPWA